MSEIEELKRKNAELEERLKEKPQAIDYESYCKNHPLDPRCLKKIEFGEDGKTHLVIDLEHADRHTIECMMRSQGVVFDTVGDSGVSGKRISKKDETEEKGCGCERKG